jgi:hypothetical protein
MKYTINGEEGQVELLQLDDNFYELFCKDHLEYHGSGVKLSKRQLEELYNQIAELLNF